MLEYVVNSVAWSLFGLGAGAVLGELGYDIGSIVRHSGRRNRNDHT